MTNKFIDTLFILSANKMATGEFPYLNSRGLYIYPCKELLPENNLRLLYSPMTRKAVWIYKKLAEYLESGVVINEKLQDIVDTLTDFIPLKDRKEKVQEVEDYPLLTVLPNQKCNLNCSYCYSAQGRSDAELSLGKLKNAINFFMGKKRINKPLSISFMGGGEPLLSWHTVKEGILYAKEKADSLNIPVDFTIITNGTIMTDEMLKFIQDNPIKISVSFEIIEEIQNKQRGAYNKVVHNINQLLSNNIIPQINATITPANADRMLEMYELLENQFPKITNMMFEPVTSFALFPEAGDLAVFLKKYADNFLKIDSKARLKNKSLTSFPYLRTVFPVERACAGEFCLTAEGKISGCYCIATKNDAGLEKCIYGEVIEKQENRDNVIHIDRDVFKNLLNDNVYTKKKCDNCVVKWNCGGGCFYLRHCYPEDYQEVFCNFTRDFVQRVILSRYERIYEKLYGRTPKDDIQNMQYNYKILEVR